jgi:hypothetical protein
VAYLLPGFSFGAGARFISSTTQSALSAALEFHWSFFFFLIGVTMRQLFTQTKESSAPE